MVSAMLEAGVGPTAKTLNGSLKLREKLRLRYDCVGAFSDALADGGDEVVDSSPAAHGEMRRGKESSHDGRVTAL